MSRLVPLCVLAGLGAAPTMRSLCAYDAATVPKPFWVSIDVPAMRPLCAYSDYYAPTMGPLCVSAVLGRRRWADNAHVMRPLCADYASTM